MSTPSFGGRALPWLIGVSAASLLGGILLAIFAPDLAPVSTVAPSGYSRSAIGHEALVGVLDTLDVPVVVSRHRSARKVGPGGVLVVAEPRVDEPDLLPDQEAPGRRLERMIGRAPATLLVLPKWEGDADPQAPNWVRRASLVARDDVQAVLDALGIDAKVVRVPAAALTASGFDGTEAPPAFLGDVAQVLVGPGIEGVIRTAEGALVAEVAGRGPALLLLADPEPISNAGLHRGANAVFVVGLIEGLRGDGGAVVFDETMHGFESNPSIWKELFTFPLVLVVLHITLLLGVLLWATMGRFGAPQKPPPALEPGTAFLVSSTADLLRHGTRAPRALGRFLDVTLRTAATALHAPSTLRGEERDAWLDRIAARRGVELRVADLRAAVRHAEGKPSRVRAAAQEIYRWREEIQHGSVRRTHAA